MENLLILREHVQEIYAKKAGIIDKGINFFVALITFLVINSNIGFMKIAASPIVSIGLAIICAFLPRGIIVIFSTLLMLLHFYSLSLGILLVTAVIFLVMYIFYFRMAPNGSLIIILTPLAFFLKVPYIIPIIFGLIATPIAAIPIAFGTIVYYMMEYVKKISTSISSGSDIGMMETVTTYIKQVFQDKEMLLYLIGFAICVLLVYTIRHMAINYAWKVALFTGAVTNIIIIAIGDIVLDLNVSYVSLVLGNILAIGIGLILEVFFFTVDYSRRESLEFEDDDYVYFVKAVPKTAVSRTKKTVKKINEQRETEILDADKLKDESNDNNADEDVDDKTRVIPKSQEEEIDEMLFTRSIQKELNIKK
ncbi:MAG: hypothetical protein ACK5LL_08835 [Suipraeoptans sp.]